MSISYEETGQILLRRQGICPVFKYCSVKIILLHNRNNSIYNENIKEGMEVEKRGI